MYKFQIQNEHVRLNVHTIANSLHQLTFDIDKETGRLTPGTLLEIRIEKNRVTPYEKEPLFLSKKAQHILDQTCHQIELALSHVHTLQELSHLEFDPSLDEIQAREMLHAAWYAIGREDAERFLLAQEKGTYLFRKDRFAGCLEEILVTAKKTKIKCYTLTYLDMKGQVRDKTIVHWSGMWMFYDDDLTLSGDHCSSLQALVSSLKSPMKAIKLAH